MWYKLKKIYIWVNNQEKQVWPQKKYWYWTINWYTDTGESFSPTTSGSYGYTCWLNISWDWNKLYCWWSSSMWPYEVTLNNGSLSGATATSQGSYHPSGWWWPCEVVWKPDWSMFYLSQNSNWHWTKWYTAATAWNMAWATEVQTIAQTFCSRWRYIDTQNWLYVVSMWPDSAVPWSVDRLSTYRLWTARDVSSGLTYVSDNNIWCTSQGDGWIFFNENWTHLYLWTSESPIYVAHYVLSTPWDVSTCTLVEKYSWSDFWLSNSRWWWICFYWTNMYLWNNWVLKRYTVTYNS